MNVTFVHCSPDAENLIVKMARVSNPANEDNVATAPKLLRYLIDHQHWSPFEMCSLCVKIDTERDISAQILRHRSFSFQEFSTRYAQVHELTLPDLRKQDLKNRQNSTDDLDVNIKEDLTEDIVALYMQASELYQDMLDVGVAKECARRILPLSTQTTLYMHGTLRSWIHYINVRTDPGTQLEHRLIAENCKQIFIEQFPTIGEAAFKMTNQQQPTNPDFRALCAMIVELWDADCDIDLYIINELRELLATPPPEPPSEKEIEQFVESIRMPWILEQISRATDPDPDFDVVIVRAALERWGK